jgi:hypothetical protein
VVAIVFLMLLTVGAIEVAFVLYGRNVLAASAHEGARAAVELGRAPSEAVAIANNTVRSSIGGLVRELDVSVTTLGVSGRSTVKVSVSGTLKPFGPIPIPIRFSSSATAARKTGA